MVRKEICASNGVKLVFHIEGATVKAHWIYDPDNPHWVEYVEKHAQPGEFAANDFIELGQTLSSVEQGEARDKIDDYNFQLRELGNEIQRAFEGGGGQNE